MFITVETPTPQEQRSGPVLSNEQDVPDQEIVRRIIAGDRDLFREIVRRNRGVVFSSIMRQVGDRELASELAQESFVKAFRGLNGFRFEAKLSSWLVCIALNTVSTYFASRAHRERSRTTSFSEPDHDRGESSTPEELHSEQLRLARFQEALAELPKQLREILVLCGLEGKSYEEAAALTGIPIGTVRSRLHKARLTMRALVGPALKEGSR